MKRSYKKKDTVSNSLKQQRKTMDIEKVEGGLLFTLRNGQQIFIKS